MKQNKTFRFRMIYNSMQYTDTLEIKSVIATQISELLFKNKKNKYSRFIRK